MPGPNSLFSKTSRVAECPYGFVLLQRCFPSPQAAPSDSPAVCAGNSALTSPLFRAVTGPSPENRRLVQGGAVAGWDAAPEGAAFVACWRPRGWGPSPRTSFSFSHFGHKTTLRAPAVSLCSPSRPSADQDQAAPPQALSHSRRRRFSDSPNPLGAGADSGWELRDPWGTLAAV